MSDRLYPHTALYIGEVVEREDPDGLGRVRVQIPGLIQDKAVSAWAYPLGTHGGGSGQRGFFAVPEKGAAVGVLFHQGHIDYPYYISGSWGKPDGKTEVPQALHGLSPAEIPHVRVFETPRFTLAFDDRGGKQGLVIQDKLSGDKIEFDGLTMGIAIESTSELRLKAKGRVTIEALDVQVNGRPVLLGPKPI